MIVDLSKKIESKKDAREADLELLKLFRNFIDEAIDDVEAGNLSKIKILALFSSTSGNEDSMKMFLPDSDRHQAIGILETAKFIILEGA